MAREEGLPGLLYFAVFSSAPVVLNVALRAIDLTEIRVTDAEEVRPQAPDGHFGDVCEGLADGTAKKEASHLLIESGHIRVLNGGSGLLLEVIDPVEFPRDDRQDGDDDPHRTEHGVVYSLADFQGVLDALVVAVKPATIRLNGACLDDEEGQSRHEEAEEVEADEQHPLAAAFPRVVVERRAAAVLTLRDDRLVVLVALHGAGCGEPPGALRAAAAQERVCGLGTRWRVCSPAE